MLCKHPCGGCQNPTTHFSFNRCRAGTIDVQFSCTECGCNEHATVADTGETPFPTAQNFVSPPKPKPGEPDLGLAAVAPDPSVDFVTPFTPEERAAMQATDPVMAEKMVGYRITEGEADDTIDTELATNEATE